MNIIDDGMKNFDELRYAHKGNDARVINRINAVRMFYVKKMSVNDVADILDYSPDWVRKWIKRYDDGGLDGLRDLPRPGRPPLVLQDKLKEVIIESWHKMSAIPKMLQSIIFAKLRVKFSVGYVRKILHKFSMSPKTATKYHINRASPEAVYRWRYCTKQQISRLETEGFTILVADEAFFMHEASSGCKTWSPVGERIFVPYLGSHQKIAAYGRITSDGRQLFRFCDRFNSDSFMQHLKDLRRRFNKVAVIVDRAAPHRSKKIKEFVSKNEAKDNLLTPWITVPQRC